MNNITIFLAAGNEELEQERLAISALTQHLNKIYQSKGRQVKLKLFKTGSEIEFSQETFENSEMLFLVTSEKMVEEDKAYFDQAFKKFEINEKPLLATYFKTGENKSDDVVEFMQFLDQTLNHYYSEYSEVEDLKCRILLNLITLDSGVSAKYYEDKIEVEGEEVALATNLQSISRNEALKNLRNEFDALIAEQKQAMQDHDELKTGESRDLVQKIQTQLEEKQKQIDDYREDIFNAMLELAKNTTKCDLLPEQKRAYKLLEAGDYIGANEVLDFSKIRDTMIDYTTTYTAGKEAAEELESDMNENQKTLDKAEECKQNAELD
ncbi:MAG: hypothetical protein R3Y27_01520 [Clostridia bacterium]